ncbi:uncharacterized protein BYT42DRAFT_614286 [Radiomyces spectabilis]|uniref:uncharacterized protein n=1 Tax=Radiomyces spectabilis TaxID=64574 RepID=UPI00222059B3|nr:uncharacterized protein BYT42DRAFT_614286 [Radiomyces spectabilis]KAI8377619.1 hypothetical protein BYT42DRAFT_614286 [Radiomyces spectabilis]
MDLPYSNRRRYSYSRASYTDDDDHSNRMSDLEGDKEFTLGRRMSTTSLSDSASSSYKMSIDSDDARSVSSVFASRPPTNYSRQVTPSTLLPTLDVPVPRRPQLTRSLSEISLSNNNSSLWASQQPSPMDSGFKQSRGIDSSMGESSNTSQTPLDAAAAARPRRLSQQYPPFGGRPVGGHTRSASNSSIELRRDPERRSVVRRSSLLPKSKALARVLTQADEDSHLADIEMRREQETTHQIKERLGRMSMDMDNGVRGQAASVPPAAWVRLRDMDSSPTMVPYQCSKLNPETEMTNFQFENLPSPVQQGFKSVKRKGSEDRLFEPYLGSSLKRRAVSPSVSLSASPVLTGISSPPGVLSQYNSSPTSSSTANAAARAQTKPGQLPTNSFNLQDASGGLSRMSLSE